MLVVREEQRLSWPILPRVSQGLQIGGTGEIGVQGSNFVSTQPETPLVVRF